MSEMWEAAEKQCGSCHQLSYCCPEHQKADWKEHRKVCAPFIVKYLDELGRYLVASRDLKELGDKRSFFLPLPHTTKQMMTK